jgi:hypothetical protein
MPPQGRLAARFALALGLSFGRAFAFFFAAIKIAFPGNQILFLFAFSTFSALIP